MIIFILDNIPMGRYWNFHLYKIKDKKNRLDTSELSRYI